MPTAVENILIDGLGEGDPPSELPGGVGDPGEIGLLLPAKGEHGLLLPAVKGQHGLLLPAVKLLIGLLLPAVLLFFLMTLLPASLTLQMFKSLGVDTGKFGDGSVLPACDSSVIAIMGDPTGVGDPTGSGDPHVGDPFKPTMLEAMFLMLNDMQLKMGQKPMMCKYDPSTSTQPPGTGGSTGPNVPYCGNGVRDYSLGESCDGSDLTGCFSGQQCSDDCSCVWVVTEEPPLVEFDPKPCMISPCPTVTPTAKPYPSSTPASTPNDICREHGGAVQYEGDTCVCPGIIDHVVICADGTKFDFPTTQSCTPTEQCTAPEPQPTEEPNRCECVQVNTCLPTASCPKWVDSCTGATCRP